MSPRKSIFRSPPWGSTNRFVGFLLFALGFSLGLVFGVNRGFRNIPLSSSITIPFSISINDYSLFNKTTAAASSVPNPPQTSYEYPGLNHTMTDEELFRRASNLPNTTTDNNQVSKLAFMFLVKAPLPLSPLWEQFFHGHEQHYTIYIHAHPSYIKQFPPNSPFHKRHIPSQIVNWGTMTMIDAEKRLLANALLDSPSNQRFILLSESCIPLYNFTTIHTYLISSPQIFLDCHYQNSKGNLGRYNHTMYPEIIPSQWRKGSQWFIINRQLALTVVPDQKYYSVFKKHCHKPCFSDEHYIPTFANIVSPWLTANRTVTWADWSVPSPHPWRFGGEEVSAELVRKMRYGTNCSYNGQTTEFCFLFARKFAGSALKPLMDLAPTVLGFGGSSSSSN